MQYTSKTALLAVALFGTSVLSLPFAGEAEYVEAREVDNDLSSREFYETHLEARADPSLDARDLKSLDFEARENLDYLKARDVATAASVTSRDSIRSAELEKAGKIFEALDFHQIAIDNEEKLNKYHLAISTYLGEPTSVKFQNVLADRHSPYHKVATRILQNRNAKAYFAADANNINLAVGSKKNKYHRQAVMAFLSDRLNFVKAYTNKKHSLHKISVRLAHKYYAQKKDKLQKQSGSATSSTPTSSSTAAPSPTSSLVATSSTATSARIAVH